ncbi:MAG: M1 family metallopeptidase [Planctomycetota bacterium]
MRIPLPPSIAAATCLLAAATFFGACSSTPLQEDLWVSSPDTHSFAHPAKVHSTHLELDLALDFDAKVARGTVTHHIERLDRSAPFVCDTNGLKIASCTDQTGTTLRYELAAASAADPILGAPLVISLADGSEQVTIAYETSPLSEAMQWLAPEQTDSKESPFLFTQGQAILTRSWIPLQDSPAVRVTWDAVVTAPEDLTTVMSANFRSRNGTVTRFRMDSAVPSYLIALACGNLRAQPISGRCAVWAEPTVVDAAARELNDLERMVAATEELFGPYRWGRYDVLFLPPSFPFGGMENPCMTFATPTILAGDKSLVALIAHELAHSWSGNLVTNATWRDFWLNEGFTVYLEQRIMEKIYGEDRAAMEIALGMQGLKKELSELPKPDQILHIDLTGRNPDDGMTAVAYDKGAAFLRRIEQVYGRERMDVFLRQWFDEHAFQSLTTKTFLEFLDSRLLSQDRTLAKQVDVETWVRKAGLPSDAPVPESERFAEVDAAARQFGAGTKPAELATEGWVTQQWLRFLSALKDPSIEQLAALDEQFAFTRSGNSEILASWLALATRRGLHAVDARMDLFLMTVGRRKFLVPLYQAILAAPASAGNAGSERALSIYRRARPRYHAVSQKTLDELLGYTE